MVRIFSAESAKIFTESLQSYMVIKSIKELMMTKHADRRLREVASMFSNASQESYFERKQTVLE